MEKNSYLLGFLLVLLGSLLILLNFKIISFSLLLLIISIGLIGGYFFQHHLGYLISGSILFIISGVSILDNAILPNINIKIFLYLLLFGIGLLVLYMRRRNKIFLIFGLILPAIGIYSLIGQTGVINAVWPLFLLIGIAFYVIYFAGFHQWGIEWPKNLARIILGISLLFLLYSQIKGRIKLSTFILYLWPVLLIIIGVKLIYNIIKLKE